MGKLEETSDLLFLKALYTSIREMKKKWIDGENKWYASIREITRHSGMRRRQAVNYLNKMEDMGLLWVVREKYATEYSNGCYRGRILGIKIE